MMKRILIVFILLTNSVCAEPISIIQINHQQIQVKLARTEQELRTGLMGQQSLLENQGMLFIFKPHSIVKFWMYHTLIPLDMIFITDGKISKIIQNAPPCRSENPKECAQYPEPGIIADEVLEVKAGYVKQHKIKEDISVNLVSEPRP